MASVTLQTLWLNDAADLADYMSFPYMSSLATVVEQSGSVRRMANGRQRVVRRAGRSSKVDADLPGLSVEQYQWLVEHIGRTLLVRDDRGRKMYAVYFDVPDEAHRYDGETDASLTLSEVSFSEAV